MQDSSLPLRPRFPYRAVLPFFLAIPWVGHLTLYFMEPEAIADAIKLGRFPRSLLGRLTTAALKDPGARLCPSASMILPGQWLIEQNLQADCRWLSDSLTLGHVDVALRSEHHALADCVSPSTLSRAIRARPSLASEIAVRPGDAHWQRKLFNCYDELDGSVRRAVLDLVHQRVRVASAQLPAQQDVAPLLAITDTLSAAFLGDLIAQVGDAPLAQRAAARNAVAPHHAARLATIIARATDAVALDLAWTALQALEEQFRGAPNRAGLLETAQDLANAAFSAAIARDSLVSERARFEAAAGHMDERLRLERLVELQEVEARLVDRIQRVALYSDLSAKTAGSISVGEALLQIDPPGDPRRTTLWEAAQIRTLMAANPTISGRVAEALLSQRHGADVLPRLAANCTPGLTRHRLSLLYKSCCDAISTLLATEEALCPPADFARIQQVAADGRRALLELASRPDLAADIRTEILKRTDLHRDAQDPWPSLEFTQFRNPGIALKDRVHHALAILERPAGDTERRRVVKAAIEGLLPLSVVDQDLLANPDFASLFDVEDLAAYARRWQRARGVAVSEAPAVEERRWYHTDHFDDRRIEFEDLVPRLLDRVDTALAHQSHSPDESTARQQIRAAALRDIGDLQDQDAHQARRRDRDVCKKLEREMLRLARVLTLPAAADPDGGRRRLALRETRALMDRIRRYSLATDEVLRTETQKLAHADAMGQLRAAYARSEPLQPRTHDRAQRPPADTL